MKPSFTPKCVRQFLIACIFILISLEGFTQGIETFTTGSFIINMGGSNSTITTKALKPYGMVYDLMRNDRVPVKWIINQAKVKDGIDFTYNGVSYKGSAFIIPKEFINPAISAKIANWVAQGVQGTYSTSPLTLDVFKTMVSIPKWTLDKTNGRIAETFLLQAGINNISFPGAYNWKTPASLGCCDDFFVMPHADPTWATHGNLWNWNQGCRGTIWAGCHAVSVLESLSNPSNPAQKMNLLSTNGLILFGAHSGGTPPYTHRLPDDPVAQYLGVTDLAHTNGSEQIYIPNTAGGNKWRAATHIIAYDASQSNVPALAPDLSNAATLIAWGRGFGDNNNGYVMYEAGHNINKGTPNGISAMRAFFNFSFFQVIEKSPILPAITGVVSGQNTQNGTALTCNIGNATSIIAGTTFTYQWRSSCGGTFTPASGLGQNVTWNPPTVGSIAQCLISCTVTDNCNRASFQTASPIWVLPPPSPPTANPDAATITLTCGAGTPVTTNVLANDTDPSGLPLTLTNVTGAVNGTVAFTASGDITFTPDANFTGVTLTYTMCNNAVPSAQCVNGTYTISTSGGATPTVANDVVNIAEDSVVKINVLANDGAGLSVAGVYPEPSNGKASINTDGTITYLPNADFAGTDNFTYKVVNPATGKTNTATVTVNITNNSCDAGTYQNGYTGGGGVLSLTPIADTYLNEASSTKNYGTCTTLLVDGQASSKQRGILKFDLSSIPAGATITGATLQLVATAVQSNTAYAIEVHDVTTAWAEGAICNASGTANWNAGSPWTTAGGDYDATIQGTTNVSTTGTYTWTLNNSLIQGWYNTPASNLGMLLRFNNETLGNQVKTFSSKENLTNIPLLTITYTTSNGLGNATATNIGDNDIHESIPTTNYGGCNLFEVGGRTSNNNKNRSIIRFSLAAVPAGSTISSSMLNLKIATGTSTTQAIDIFRLTRASTEGTGICSGNAGMVSHWNNAATGIPWTTAGGDFTGNTGAAPYATTTVNNGTAVGTNISWNITSLVNEWSLGTYSNFGLIMKGPETVNGLIDFWSREAATAFERPELTVFYQAPPNCLAIPARAPMAMPDTASTPNGIAINFATATNDYFPVAGAKTYSIITAPVSGTASINAATGVITYTPATTFNGMRSMIYRVLDNTSGLADTAYAYVNITNGHIVANDDAPAAANSAVVQTINVKANDVDPENAVLDNTYAVTILTQPLRGSAIVNGSGDIVYTPVSTYTGKDTLYYVITEPSPSACGNPTADTAMVVITMLNQSPIPNDDTRTMLPCAAITINLLSNDTDPENGVLTVTNLSVPVPNLGTLTNNNDGTVTFMPNTGASGTTTFTYTVTDNGVPPITSLPATVSITIVMPLPSNNPPVAIDDYADTTNMDEALYESVLDNDTDPDGNALTNPSVTVNPLHGLAVVLASGLIRYTPNPGFFGADTLTYLVCDIINNPATCSPSPGFCVAAKMFIYIRVPNTTYAVNDENSTWVNMPVSGGVIDNDYDIERDAISFTGFLDNSNSLFMSGSIIVSGVDTSGTPVANAGSLAIGAGGTYTYTAANGFAGVITAAYTIADNNPNAAVDTAFLKITVSPLKFAYNSVIANNDENITYGNPVSGNVLVNDRDPQGNGFSVSSFIYDTNGDGIYDGTGTVGSAIMTGGMTTMRAPVNNAGTLTLNGNGTYSFTPAPDFHGSVDIPYSICDNGVPVICATALLHFDVMPDINGPLNDPPFAGDDFGYTDINVALTGPYFVNDQDPNSDGLKMNGILINTGGAHTLIQTDATQQGGSVQFFSDGTYTYTPPLNYSGPDLVNYSICDATAVAPQPLCATGELHFLVITAIALPVDVLTFTGKRSGKDNLLEWSTAQELNSHHIEIENRTAATAFIKIGSVTAKGNSSVRTDYSFVHRDPPAVLNYYRLKLVDIDGKYSYSKTVAIKNDGIGITLNSVYPNPFRDQVNITISFDHAEKLTINLYDLSGKLIRTNTAMASSGLNTINLNGLRNLAAATYFLEIKTNEETMRAKLFKTF